MGVREKRFLTRSMFDRYNIVSEDDLRIAMQKTTWYLETLPTKGIAWRCLFAKAPPNSLDELVDCPDGLTEVREGPWVTGLPMEHGPAL